MFKFYWFYFKIDYSLLDYSPIMTKLGQCSLTDRKYTVNLKLFKRIINGTVDTPELLSVINFETNEFNTRHTYPFSVHRCLSMPSTMQIRTHHILYKYCSCIALFYLL